MRAISQFVSRFVVISSRLNATGIVLALLVCFAESSLEREVKARVAPVVPMAAESGFLYVLNTCNGCANEIFGFAVDETTGALTTLTSLGFPIPTGGRGRTNSIASELMTIDRKNLRLFAINDTDRTVSAFKIDPATGVLTALPFSPFQLPLPTSDPAAIHWSTIAVRPNGSDSLLVVGDIGQLDPRLASFKVTETEAKQAAGSPYSTGLANPLSTAFSQDGAFVYAGGGTSGRIFTFQSTDPEGVLVPLDSLGTNSGDENPSGYATDATGRLFVVSRPFSRPRVYITPNGGPQFVSSLFDTRAGDAADGVLHPNGDFYLASEVIGSHVSVFMINGSGAATTLTRVTDSPFSSGGNQVSLLAFNQDGRFLFAANNQQRTLTTFDVDRVTGVLTIKVTQPDNTMCALGPSQCNLRRLSGIAYLGPRTTTMTIDAPDVTCGDDAIVTVNVNSPAGNPTGDVKLTVDGGPPITQPLVGDPSATFTIPAQTLTAGTHTLVATYDAQNGYGPSSASKTFAVNIISTTTTIDAPAITFGENGNVTVQVTSPLGTPTGEVKLAVDGVELPPQTLSGGIAIFPIPQLNAGDHTLAATFAQQGCLGASSDTGTLVVKVAPTKTFVTSPTIIAGLDAAVIVKVTSPFAVPLGEVRLKVDGVAVPSKTLSNGAAIFVIRAPTVGFHKLVANFPAQGNFAASSGAAKLIVKAATPTVTTISPLRIILRFPLFGQVAPVTVKVTSSRFPFPSPVDGGRVSLKVDNGRAITQTLSGGKAIFNLVPPAAGFHSLNATFLGVPGAFAPSSAHRILLVEGPGGASETKTTIKAPAITFGQNGSITVTVTSAGGIPRGNVSLTVDGVAMPARVLAGGSFTFTIKRPAAGNHEIIASFTGTSDFASSKAVGNLVVKPPLVRP